MKLFRRGQWKEVTVKVDANAEERSSQPQTQGSKGPESSATVDTLGVSVANLTQEEAKKLGIESGVRVESVNNAARRFGIRVDDVILEVGNTKVKDTSHFESLIKENTQNKRIVLLIRRGNGVVYIIAQLPSK